MSFFDKKEEVLDIQLTPHGKELLSQGKFEPYYYSFFDNDILYDLNHTGIQESSKDIHDRIKDSIYKKLPLRNVSVQTGSLITQQTKYILNNPVGTSDGNDKFPAWNIQFEGSEISSSATHYTSSYGDVNIPQLNLHPLYIKTREKKENLTESLKTIDDLVQEYCVDDEYVPDKHEVYQEDFIELFLEEKNNIINSDDLEIELYEVEGDILKPLHFHKKKELVVNGILMDEESILSDVEPFGPLDVEYYFDIETKKKKEMDSVDINNTIYNIPIAEDTEEC